MVFQKKPQTLNSRALRMIRGGMTRAPLIHSCQKINMRLAGHLFLQEPVVEGVGLIKIRKILNFHVFSKCSAKSIRRQATWWAPFWAGAGLEIPQTILAKLILLLGK